MMDRRRALMMAQETTSLPEEYQEVEYIGKASASAADTYLKTGKRINNTYPTVFKGKFYPTAFGSVDGFSACIKRANDKSAPIAIGLKNGINIHNGSTSNTLVQVDTRNKIIEFVVTVTDEGFQLDATVDGQPQTGNLQATPTSWVQNPYDVLYLSSDYGSQCFSGRYYYAKVIQGGITIIDLVPCYRKSDNKIGMYDRVSKSFKSVTGTWTKGADVN